MGTSPRRDRVAFGTDAAEYRRFFDLESQSILKHLKPPSTAKTAACSGDETMESVMSIRTMLRSDICHA